jgi:hypothetical protein
LYENPVEQGKQVGCDLSLLACRDFAIFCRLVSNFICSHV